MKTYQVTKREGEYLGPVDWSYNFLQHFDCYCTDDIGKQKACDRQIEVLRKLLSGPEWEATTYGGWPRCGWGEVLKVGMYDGWPYWKPVPSVLTTSVLGGGEWHPFCNITDIRLLVVLKQEV